MKFRSKWEIAILSALLGALTVSSNSIAATISGNYLPDSLTTPGSLNPAVNQSNIFSTICVSGYTATVRPPSSFTTHLKEEQLNSPPYSAFKDTKLADFEEDHFISLELGGSPTDSKNLWPEPLNGAFGARTKDKLENKLHSMVCSKTMTLATAQHLITTDWYSAYSIYVLGKGAVSGASSKKSTNPKQSTTNTAKIPSWPQGATAKCRDGTFSHSLSHRGSCSHHHGVESFKQ